MLSIQHIYCLRTVYCSPCCQAHMHPVFSMSILLGPFHAHRAPSAVHEAECVNYLFKSANRVVIARALSSLIRLWHYYNLLSWCGNFFLVVQVLMTMALAEACSLRVPSSSFYALIFLLRLLHSLVFGWMSIKSMRSRIKRLLYWLCLD